MREWNVSSLADAATHFRWSYQLRGVCVVLRESRAAADPVPGTHAADGDQYQTGAAAAAVADTDSEQPPRDAGLLWQDLGSLLRCGSGASAAVPRSLHVLEQHIEVLDRRLRRFICTQCARGCCAIAQTSGHCLHSAPHPRCSCRACSTLLLTLLLPTLSVALHSLEVVTEDTPEADSASGKSEFAPSPRLRAAVRSLTVYVRAARSGGVRCSLDVVDAEAQGPEGQIALTSCAVQAVRAPLFVRHLLKPFAISAVCVIRVRVHVPGGVICMSLRQHVYRRCPRRHGLSAASWSAWAT